MTIPDFQSIMLPLMQFASDEQEHSLRETIEYLSEHFHLIDSERKELLPSGRQPIFDNRVGWSRTHLRKADLLEPTRRAYFRITLRGIDLLKQQPFQINMNLLKQYPEYLEFIGKTSQIGSVSDSVIVDEAINQKTPQEILEDEYQKLRETLAQEILEKVKCCSPKFFEQLVVELLVKMGYGGSIKEAGRAIGKAGDEGIDGIIKEDRLGLDTIYVQAKRWNDTVGRPEIQRFVGALAGQGAKKGVFITTSKFSEQAKDYAPRNDTKVVLIDGEELAQFMIDFDLGVSLVSEYQVKKIDSDYFGDE
jgi:restriction system protein